MTTNKTVTGENIYYAGLVVHVSFTEKISLHAITGDYDIKLSLASLTAKYTGEGNVSWLKAPKGKIKLHKKEVLAMEDLVLSLLPRSDKLTVERRRMEGGERASWSRTAASWLPSSRLYTSDYFIA